MKLAAFYTIKNNLYPREKEFTSMPYQSAYMDAGRDKTEKIIEYDSGSDFSKAINGRNAYDVWAVMDELMDALMAINPRLYNSVMRKI